MGKRRKYIEYSNGGKIHEGDIIFFENGRLIGMVKELADGNGEDVLIEPNGHIRKRNLKFDINAGWINPPLIGQEDLGLLTCPAWKACREEIKERRKAQQE